MTKAAAINAKRWESIKQELNPSHLLKREHLVPAIISGAMIGLMTTILSISFAVLVFGKAIPEALSIGIGMALFSNIILHLGSALGSSGEGIISHVQSLPPPIQAAMLSSLMGVLPLTMPNEDRVVVAVVTILLSAIITGIVLFVFGQLKFGQLVRLLPLPVIGGFLASVGFALVIGGVSTMIGIKVTLSSVPHLFTQALILRWLPGVVLAAILWIVTARWKNVLLFPTILSMAVAGFYLTCYALGLKIADLRANNLLLGPFSNDSLWQPSYFYWGQINTIDWTVITTQMGIMATLPLVCFIGGLLMVSAIEFSTGSEMNPSFELKTMGVSNFISGIAGGGFIGYPSTTFTVMQRSLGASTRLAGILSALIPLIVLLAGANFLGFIPRFVVSGLLIYFGYQFIDHWLVKQIKQFTVSDMSIIGVIVVTSLRLDFVSSVGVGILAAVGIFLVKYGQTSVVRYVATGASLRSRVTRNATHDDWLSAHANRISIFGLQGYIFFGTAYTLHEDIMSRVTDTHQATLDSVILDFRQVTGIDTSVVQSFHKLYVQLKRKGVTLIFVQMPPKYRGLMQKIVSNEKFAEYDSLDEALEWRENHLLEHSDLPPYLSRTLLAVFTEHFKDASKAEILLQYLNRLEIPTHTKIIEQNTLADDLFFIESGRLSTYLEQKDSPPIRLQTMVDDTVIGEIGFYLGDLRTATVIADKPSVVYRLSITALAQMEKENPAVAIELHRLIVEKTAKRVNHVFRSVKSFM
jgi:sulfate permease, SulP family